MSDNGNQSGEGRLTPSGGSVQIFLGNFPPGEPPQMPRSPESIQGIHFEGVIAQSQFDLVMSPLVNLTTLDLHLPSLAHLNLKNSRRPLRLDVLRNLQISSTNFSSQDAQNHDMELILENAMALINLRFPLVTYLALSVPNLTWMESKWTSALIHALTRNKGLKYFNMESPFSLTPNSNDALPYPQFECPRESLRELKTLFLTSFHYSSILETESTSFWKEFSKGQSQLEYFHFWVQGHSPFPPSCLEEILRTNRGTLKTVAVNNLTHEQRSGPLLSGRAFQHCTQLRTLYMMGVDEPEPPIGEGPPPRRPSFKEFNLLPYSLEILRIHNLTLSLSDTKFISHNLQNLTFLELINVGEDGNLGLNLENLPTLLAKKKIEGVEIVQGLNNGSLQVSPEDKGWKNIAKILFQKQSKSWFRAVKDPVHNTFEIVHRPESDDEDESDPEADSDTDPSSTASWETLVGAGESARSAGKHEIHGDERSRIIDPNAKQLYANRQFDPDTSSQDLNRSKS